MVPHHSRLTSQPILASLFPSYFCNNSREPSPWPVLPAMPISKPIVSTLTIYSRAGQWSRFQLSCMGCEWGKRKKKKWVLFFHKADWTGKNEVLMINNNNSWSYYKHQICFFFSPKSWTHPSQGRRWCISDLTYPDHFFLPVINRQLSLIYCIFSVRDPVCQRWLRQFRSISSQLN